MVTDAEPCKTEITAATCESHDTLDNIHNRLFGKYASKSKKVF